MRNLRGRAALPTAALLLFASLSGCLGWLDDDSPLVSGTSWSIPGAILLDDAFTDLVVEVDYTSSYEPSPMALAALEETLAHETLKHSITILPPTREAPLGGVHSEQEVQEYHLTTRQHGTRDKPWEGSTFYLHVLYLDGQMEDTGLLGIYHGSGDITILSDLIPTMVGPYVLDTPQQIGAEQAERKSLIHELGHAFGLVNCGIPMTRPHEDPRSKCHSISENSVMSYWNWTPPQEDPVRSVHETIEVGWHFDEDDLADLAGFRRTGQTFYPPVTLSPGTRS